MAKTKRPVTKSGRPRSRKGVKVKPTELTAKQIAVAADALDGAALALSERITSDGGHVLCSYREPLGGNVQLLAALPIEQVEPTPFQRDVSDAHVRKLTQAMDRTRRYLDPIIVVRAENAGRYYTPNGNHRLTVMKELGAKTIVALVVPEERVAFQILALNIEKAHNLREKALEVFRMYGELIKLSTDAESTFALEFEEPQLITLGFAYSERGRFSGGAYQSAIKKVDVFLETKLPAAYKERERRGKKLLVLDDAVSESVEKLKARGFQSPYLKAFVVARINPLRFIKGTPPSFDELLDTMTKRARGMDAAKIKSEDIARSGGAPEE